MVESYTFQGTPSFILAQKLQALKEDLKKWNREELGDVRNRKKELKEITAELDTREEQNWNLVPKMQNLVIWWNPNNFILIHILGVKCNI